MYLYFGLNINDIADFCKLVNKEKNRGYEVNDKVFINITDGIFVRTYTAKSLHYVIEEGFVIIGFDDVFEELKPNKRITLKSFKNLNEEIRLKVFDIASNVNIRDNFKFTVGNSAIKSENVTKPDNKQTYYFTLTKDDCKKFVHKNGDIQSIKTAIWNENHTDFTLGHVLIEPVITVSISSDSSIFRILNFDSENFVVSKDSYNAYKKTIYFDNSDIIVEFFTDLDDCIRFAKTKKEEPKITNKLEEQVSWDYKPLNMSKEENKMTIKDIKKNGPATIIFWVDGDKTVVKCQPGDQDDIEKGVIMALVKEIVMRRTNKRDWTSVFDIPYTDEIDVEKVIGLSFLKGIYGKTDKEWHYRQVLRWVYKIKGYAFEDEVKALLALGYSKDRIKKCLNTNLGAIRDALETKTETETEKSNEHTYADTLKDPEEEPKDIPMSDKVMEMFNKGIKIAQIARELGITEYFVKKALDEATKPKSSPRKVDKVLKKAIKSSKKEKKERKPPIRLTEIPFVDYLTKEENEQILEMTKQKYAGRYKHLSELRDFYIREAKLYKIQQCYGNGYTMYEIAGILGISASGVQRIRNQANTSGGDPSEE